MSDKVQLTGRLICASDAESEIVRQYLPDHIRLTRQEPGCLLFEVAQTTDPLVWSVEEVFADQAAFDAHQARAAKSEWARQTSKISRNYVLTRSDRS